MIGYLGREHALFGRQYTEEITDSRGTHRVLRYDGEQAQGRWEAQALKPGQALQKPRPLFTKLDPDAIAQESSDEP